MDTTEARTVVAAYYHDAHPEHSPQFATQYTPRGFFLHAAAGWRTFASAQRSDSRQNESQAAGYDRLAEACDVLAEEPTKPSRHVCTAADPWTPAMGTGGIHDDAVYQRDKDYGGGETTAVYECPHCGKVFEQELAQ